MRVEPELVGEREPGRPIDLERFRLAAAAVEREHQLAAQPLAQRMARDELLQLADEHRVPSELELGVDPLLLRRHPQLVQARGLEPGELLLLEVGERRPVPEVERLAQQPRPRRRLRCPGLVHEPFEAVAVDRLPRDGEPVARRLRDDDVPSDELAQRRDGVLEGPVADAGARSPQRSATRRSVETTSPARSASAASSARCCRRGSEMTPSPSRTSRARAGGSPPSGCNTLHEQSQSTQMSRA